jgi:hypothetical protein
MLAEPHGYYNLLSISLLAGQLSLLKKPCPELLALPDPYDPKENEKYRMHDLSLYDGKYFLPFGITPAVLLFIPIRFLCYGYMPESLAVPIFFAGGFLVSLALLRVLLRSNLLHVPFSLIACSILLLGLGNSIPFTLRRPAVYEVAISCGYLCLMFSLYFLISWHFKNFQGCWRPFLGGIFMGLAVGSRPNLILAASILPLLTFFIHKELPGSRNSKIPILLSFWLPFLIVLLLIFFYNYFRFGSFTEFGFNYQLAGFHPRKIKPLMLAAMPVGLYSYLWQRLDFSGQFPYVRSDFSYPGHLPDGYIGLEPVAGIIYLAPFVLFSICLFPFFLLKERFNAYSEIKIRKLSPYILYFLATGFGQVAFLSLKPGVTMRYIVDFAPLFLMAAILSWFIFIDGFSRHLWVRKGIYLLGIVAIIYGLTVNIALSVTGYYDNFKRENPGGYRAVKALLQSWREYFISAFASDPVILDIEVPNGLDSSKSFWIGEEETQIRVFAPRNGTLRMCGRFAPGPTVSPSSQFGMDIHSDSGYQNKDFFYGNGNRCLAIPVVAGINQISLRAIDKNSQTPYNKSSLPIIRVEYLTISDYPEFSSNAEIMSVENLNGVNDDFSFWMGQGHTVLRIYSPIERRIFLSMVLSPGPSKPEDPERRIWVGQEGEQGMYWIIRGEETLRIPLSLKRGMNRIVLRSLDSPTLFQLPNGDTRPLMVRVKILQLE